MSENNLSDLLEKYYQGDTSLEEERTIFDFMTAHPAHRHAPWFLGREQLAAESSLVTNAPFRNRMSGHRPWYNTTQFRVAASLLLICASIVAVIQYQYGKNFRFGSTNTVRQITLPDGSAITLNKHSSIRYTSNFKNAREVWLEEGEAFFEVVRDVNFPFIVHAGETTTQVLGTSFNVRSERDLTYVSVLSGKVSLRSLPDNDSTALILTKGMGGEFNVRTRELKKIPAFDGNNLAWKTHRLEFRDTPLKAVLETLEDYFQIQIETQDSSILTCRFRGVFEDADLKEIYSVMEYSLNLQITPDGSVHTISGRGCNP